ncbi:hypothetical protein GCM10007972_23830 [Iodidimonas muriae]|uniref:Uncharacterized protein n=1 Tax=Iodidimonas muriae TaxID=261467 RepID=A0ABQ2LFK7_9PROT|nr:hypothetical protein [Iodidimonas muriae]GER08575.1 hypothetical protein JCM17843_28850 [Kordiimonadales bacterium JCM 17843]GGO15573.1 hypothetical protein GCM10007972_23830 [Iodidimonas muriae]
MRRLFFNRIALGMSLLAMTAVFLETYMGAGSGHVGALSFGFLIWAVAAFLTIVIGVCLYFRQMLYGWTAGIILLFVLMALWTSTTSDAENMLPALPFGLVVFWSWGFRLFQRVEFATRKASLRLFFSHLLGLSIFSVMVLPPLWLGKLIAWLLALPFFGADYLLPPLPDSAAVALIAAAALLFAQDRLHDLHEYRLVPFVAVTISASAIAIDPLSSLFQWQLIIAFFLVMSGWLLWWLDRRHYDFESGILSIFGLRVRLKQAPHARIGVFRILDHETHPAEDVRRDMVRFVGARLSQEADYGACRLEDGYFAAGFEAGKGTHEDEARLWERGQYLAQEIQSYTFRIRRRNRPENLAPEDLAKKRGQFYFFGSELHIVVRCEAILTCSDFDRQIASGIKIKDGFSARMADMDRVKQAGFHADVPPPGGEGTSL